MWYTVYVQLRKVIVMNGKLAKVCRLVVYGTDYSYRFREQLVPYLPANAGDKRREYQRTKKAMTKLKNR